MADKSPKVQEFEARLATATYENLSDVLSDMVCALINDELTPAEGKMLNRLSNRRSTELRQEASPRLSHRIQRGERRS